MAIRKTFPKLSFSHPPTVTAIPHKLKQTFLQPNFRLPPSYCDFAQQCGYGLLCNLLIVYIPMPGCDGLAERNAVLTHVIHEGVANGWFEYEPDGSPELVRRLIPFGISENGHILAWNPHEQTNKNEHYIYTIGSKLLAVRRAAPDLFSLVEMCLDERVRGILGSGYTPLPPTFHPYKPNFDPC